MSKHDYSQRKYEIVPYDQNWPIIFEKVKDEVAPIFGGIAEKIEHIGSTSVPGMVSKPTVDILITVKDINLVDELNDKMADLGYEALGEYVTPGSRLFALNKDGNRLINIHCFPIDHEKSKRFLLFRDHLRSHPEEAAAYSKLKLDLFEKYPDDYGAYRQKKDAYMKELEKRAEI
ncbi:MAG: GrpB family protein [Patescibacteria group bacterium]|nr:GrpB family protein [Patescibacteria group bacterium]